MKFFVSFFVSLHFLSYYFSVLTIFKVIVVELFIGERKRSKRRHSFKNFKCLYSKSRDSVQSTNYNDFNITTSPPLKLPGVAKTTKHEGNKV